MYLEQNIRGICDKFGLDYLGFMADLGIETVDEMTISDVEIICEEYGVDAHALIFKHIFKSNFLKVKIDKVKLLVVDVDGVMTDGGMYFSESGDQFKKFNTKDGMAIMHLTQKDFQVAIISSGFKGEAVQQRADMLGIQHCSVSREPKLKILNSICEKLGIDLKNVAILGDDVNDLEIMRAVGFSACPKDAVNTVKAQVDIILNTKGGEGCVREFIDNYILNKPME